MVFAMFYHVTSTLLVIQFSYLWLEPVNCIVSQWDPFCKEDLLYIPYVRIFQKGRSGAMIRDRGPGFIDVAGMQDIYVCTNGLVMLYYSKPKGSNIFNGEIYENGEMHWAPHHCELYNPSCTAHGVDKPIKTLVSILLIAHPQDYRRPALQMFVAPTYDVVYQNYVNLTSLIMIGHDGECLLEKGLERARIRVRISAPNISLPEPTAWFCQLDSQRKLGQYGVVNLYKHDDFPEYFNTTLHYYEFGPEVKNIKTGPTIHKKYQATNVDPLLLQDASIVAQDADRVYAALLNDRPIKFVGCLQYPDFSTAQYDVLFKKTKMITGDGAAIPKLEFAKEPEYVPTDTAPPFWAQTVDEPWAAASATSASKITRFAIYANTWTAINYTTITFDIETKKTDLANAIKNNQPPLDIEKIKQELKELEMKFSLWPYREIYIAITEYLKSLEKALEASWESAMEEIDLSFTKGATSSVDPKDINTYDAKTAAEVRTEILRNLSSDRFDRRFDPYNPGLATEYNENVNKLKQLEKRLRDRSTFVGPFISDAETFYSQYKTYKTLAKHTLADFEGAIKLMEKTKQSVPKPSFGMPYDRYFTDTRIAISDARDKDKPHVIPEDNPDPGAKACYALPAPISTCKGIKPESSRACQICKNRKNQGIDWIPGTEWKEEVLDLIESIYKRVCPYISDEFAISINRILKGYLQAYPMGTGLSTPINGSRMYKADHNYQLNVYNSTYWALGTAVDEKSVPVTPAPTPPSKELFWDHIKASLNDCLARAEPMDFYYNEDADQPTYTTFRMPFANNKSEAYFDVEDLFMQEKADYEFNFNWAIDMNWRIFSTVLGYCMPHYETKIPLISAQFYALYSKHFLHPLRQIWMSNRDNPVLKTILGSFYGTGKGERWGKICMESSFMQSGDLSYRPPRYLYVNAFTEMNYFTTGPMSGTSGQLLETVING